MCAAEEKTIVVKEGDTCIKLALEAGVTAGTLQQRNSIADDCRNLQIGQELCVPKDCNVFKVTAGMDCNAVAAANSISVEQLFEFNPVINKECTNLLADTNVCVSAAPTAAVQTAPAQTEPAPACTAEEKTVTVQADATCIKLALEAGVTAAALQLRNNIPAECNNLQVGQQLCVPKDCNVVKVNAGDTCDAISTANNISVADFRLFNPTIDEQCSNLLADSNVCVSAPPACNK
jgi:LysM repeat protein